MTSLTLEVFHVQCTFKQVFTCGGLNTELRYKCLVLFVFTWLVRYNEVNKGRNVFDDD